MQPGKTGVSSQFAVAVWHTFMQTGTIPDGSDRPDPVVLQSWRRCISRFNPYAQPRMGAISTPALRSIMRGQQELISIAAPFMEDIHQFTEGSNYVVTLSDGAACLLAIGGDMEAADWLTGLGVQRGVYWAEDSAGTNALGLVLSEAMPVQVVGAEHFFQRFHPLVTTAAPIHDVRGRIIGTLGMIGPAESATSHTLGLVMSAARAVSNQLHADWYLQQTNRHLGEVNTILGTIAEGVIVWNSSGEVSHVNQQAGSILGITPRTVVGRSLSDVVTLPSELTQGILRDEELHDEEMVFHVDDRAVRCLVTLRSVEEQAGEPGSFVALLNPIEHVRQLAQQQYGSQSSLTIDDVQAASSSMRQIIRQARTAARGTAPILIRGEGGVGKNLLARAIHNDGPRSGRPFIDINCRAIPHELMAREILGQERDANTNGQPSKFELADGGTLLLDEIESLSLEIQAALLHIIETRQVLRLGSSRTIPVDVRIIAATTADLESLVAQGSFLPHLYYRFGVFHMEIPPLRERTEDIPLLAERFLALRTERETRAKWLNDDAAQILHRYPWPGNVRELESVLERALTQNQHDTIQVADLPEFVRSGLSLAPNSPLAQTVLSVSEAEREAILRAGWACQGRVTDMARMLGIGRSTLWRKMKRYEISATRFKS